jgi:hypothetical protein
MLPDDLDRGVCPRHYEQATMRWHFGPPVPEAAA